MNKPLEELPIMYSLPLRDFVDIYLGVSVTEQNGVILRDRVYDNRPISKHHATVIEALTKNKTICYIEYPSQFAPKGADPVLWALDAWLESNERLAIMKARQHASQVVSWIFDRNSLIIARHLSNPKHPLQLGFDHALDAARMCLRRKAYGLIKWFGVEKLITKEEEL